MSKFIVHQSIYGHHREQINNLVKQALDEDTAASLYFMLKLAMEKLRDSLGAQHEIISKFYRANAHSLSRREQEVIGRLLAFVEKEGSLSEAQRDLINDISLQHAGRPIL